MYSYSHYNMFAPGRRALPGRALAAFFLALTLLALGAVAAPGRARAANGGSQINFISPIYAGQNNGFAEGPVGAVVTVAGSGWASAAGPITIDLVDTQLDASGQPGSACTSAPANKRVAISDLQPSPLKADKNDDFIATFTWPAGANTVGHSYWACGGQGGATFPGTDKYTVLGANPPSLSIGNTTTIPVKSTITVKGQNWLPGNQPVTVMLAPCLACDAQPLLTQSTTAGNDGAFSVDITLPDQVTAGTSLYVIASNNASSPQVQPALMVNGQNNAPKITVVDQPTATPTPSPTVTNTPVPTRTTTGGAGTGNTSNGSSNGLLIVLLSALGVVLVLAAVVAVLLFVRSRKPLPDNPPYGGPGGYPPQGGGYSGQYAGPRRTGGSGPTSDYTNVDYYNEPPRSGGRSGSPGGYGQRGAGWGGPGWQGGQQGQLPDDSASGDQPTISSPPPWR